jgi:uncharacterized protein (TIGR03435 family)
MMLKTAIACLVAAVWLFGQTEPAPLFQAASVKRNTDVQPRGMLVRVQPGGRLTTMNASPVLLIQNAYRVQAYEIVGGPEWLNSDGYDIEATPGGAADEAKTRLMLRSLLAERFKLTVHRETRDMPAYALTAAKGGLRLPAPQTPDCAASDAPMQRPDQSPCGVVRVGRADGGMALLGKSVRMPEFIRILASVMGRPVIDRTGFTALTDIHVTGFTPDDIPPWAYPDPARSEPTTPCRHCLPIPASRTLWLRSWSRSV